MTRLTAELTCPYCSYRFAVCIHVDALPDPDATWTVRCPMNGSDLPVAARDLRPAMECPPGAVGPVEPAPGKRGSAAGRNWERVSGSARRWWQFWRR
jgi:hypothetical protein